MASGILPPCGVSASTQPDFPVGASHESGAFLTPFSVGLTVSESVSKRHVSGGVGRSGLPLIS